MSDFKTDFAVYRAKQLTAQRLAAEARFASCEAEGDMDGAAEASDEIGAVERAGASLNEQYQAEMARRTPPPRAAPLNDQEFMALDIKRLKNNPSLRDEVLNQILSKSKYFDPSKDWNDPIVQKRVRDGQEKYDANSPEFERQAKANGR